MTKKASVNLGEALDVAHVEGLKTRLETALSKESSITLVADKVKKADSAGIQLVYAFIKKSHQNGNDVRWQKPSELLVLSSEKLGMKSHLGLD